MEEANATPLKEIVYRGGVVRFRVPADWGEEDDPQTGGTFYSKTPGAGTLRLKVLALEAAEDSPDFKSKLTKILKTMPTQPPTAWTAIKSIFRKEIPPENPIEELENGNSMTKYIQKMMEAGNALDVHFWTIGNVVSPRKARVATFSFTILESLSSDLEMKKTIELLEHEIRTCKFHEQSATTETK